MMPATSSNSASTTTVASTKRSSSSTTLAEESDRKLAKRLITDLVILVLFIVPIPICEFGIEPFRRGFFCDDDSIRYPHHGNTVTPLMLGLLAGLLPALAFILVELGRFFRRGRMSEMIFILGFKTPIWLIELVRHLWFYSVGLILTLDATEVGKYTIGRLRPHFMAVCQPILPDGTTCEDSSNHHRYIENYACRADGFTALQVIEARRSFPSGHSSLAFYAMVYVAIYMQERCGNRDSKLLRHFVQFISIMLAWFTALSRIMDNWHHWSDVLVGSIIGIIGAVLTARFIARLHRRGGDGGELSQELRQSRDHVTTLKISIPRQDTSATLEEVISTPPLYVLSTTNSFSNEQYCTKV